MIGEKVITILFLCFAMFALFLEFGARTCPHELVVSHLRNQAEFLIMNPMRNSFR